MMHLQIKAQRKRLQISMRDMATRPRISFSTYRDIEFGRVFVTRHQLERIQQVFEQARARARARAEAKQAAWNAAVGGKGNGG